MVSPIMPPGLVYHPANIHAYEVHIAGYDGEAPILAWSWSTACMATKST